MGFANFIDDVGTNGIFGWRAPEIGLSELVNGGKATQKTGTVNYNAPLATTVLGVPGATATSMAMQAATKPGGNFQGGSTTNPTTQQLEQLPQKNFSNYDGGAGGDGIATSTAPSRAALDPLFASLGSLDTILGNKNEQSQAEYNRMIAEYNANDTADRGMFDKNVQRNEGDFTANNHRALLNAANGATGLRGVLASLGALGGSGIDVIQRLVGLAANQDTGASAKNFETNAEDLNTAWSTTEQKQRQRRGDADATLSNNMQNNKASILNSRKGIFEQLANLYGDGSAEGGNYASQAAALAPEIAATTKASVAPYAAASNLYTPQALQQYLAGTQNLNVNAAGANGGQPINSPLFANEKKKDQLAGVA